MDNKITISVEVNTNSAESGLGLEVWLNDQLVQDLNPVTEHSVVSFDAADDDGGEHELRFVVKNKLPEHTKIDEQGNILSDAVITIGNLKFDEIELNHDIYDHFEYKHNFNGTGPETVDKFYGTVGCNGTLSLKFTTPMYLWLLENM